MMRLFRLRLAETDGHVRRKLVKTGRGENFCRSLISARYVSLPPEQWDQARYDESKKLAKAADDELLRRIAIKFRYRRREAVLAQALMVHVGGTGLPRGTSPSSR